MKLYRTSWVTIVALCYLVTPVLSQEVFICPDPLFECIGPGPGDDPPGISPDPIFKPVQPLIRTNVDFNRSFGIVQNGKMIVSPGTPALSLEMNHYLENHRLIIDPNAIYALSPGSLFDSLIDGETVIIGGGALTQ